MNLETVLRALPLLNLAIPEVKNLFLEIKATFAEDDRDTIERAVAESDAEADAQHNRAQGI